MFGFYIYLWNVTFCNELLSSQEMLSWKDKIFIHSSRHTTLYKNVWVEMSGEHVFLKKIIKCQLTIVLHDHFHALSSLQRAHAFLWRYHSCYKILMQIQIDQFWLTLATLSASVRFCSETGISIWRHTFSERHSWREGGGSSAAQCCW